MSFKPGDTVTYSELGVWTIIAVELEDNPFLGSTLDMGRYTVRREDGSILHNAPGYLMRESPR